MMASLFFALICSSIASCLSVGGGVAAPPVIAASSAKSSGSFISAAETKTSGSGIGMDATSMCTVRVRLPAAPKNTERSLDALVG